MKAYIDTNVFIRFLIKDIKSQAEKAEELFDNIEKGRETGIISILVMQEILWVMEDFYKIKRSIFIDQLTKIFALKNIKIKEIGRQALFEILTIYRKTSLDLTDIYLAYQAKQDKNTVFSFDRDMKKSLMN